MSRRPPPRQTIRRCVSVSFSPRIECGRVYIVEGSWNEDFLNQVCGFPSMPHDEFVDILGYAINDLYDEDEDIDYNALDKGMFGL